MEYLIDTQIVIWSIISPNKLSVKVREILQNHSIGVSQVSLYEIAIKQKIGKLPELDISTENLVNRLLNDNFDAQKLYLVKFYQIIRKNVPLYKLDTYYFQYNLINFCNLSFGNTEMI